MIMEVTAVGQLVRHDQRGELGTGYGWLIWPRHAPVKAVSCGGRAPSGSWLVRPTAPSGGESRPGWLEPTVVGGRTRPRRAPVKAVSCGGRAPSGSWLVRPTAPSGGESRPGWLGPTVVGGRTRPHRAPVMTGPGRGREASGGWPGRRAAPCAGKGCPRRRAGTDLQLAALAEAHYEFAFCHRKRPNCNSNALT